MLFLPGEPGIGKTRLLREAAELARVGGWAVLEGGCHRSSGQEPYAPMLTALERRIQGSITSAATRRPGGMLLVGAAAP